MGYKVGLKVVADGEKAFNDSLKQMDSGLKVLNSELKKVSAQYNANASSVKALSERYDVLDRQVLSQEDKVRELGRAVEFASGKYGEASEKTAYWKSRLNDAETALVKMKDDLGKTSSALDVATAKMSKMGLSQDDSTVKAEGFGSAIKELTKNTGEFGGAQEGASKSTYAFTMLASEGLSALGIQGTRGLNVVRVALGDVAKQMVSSESVVTQEAGKIIGALANIPPAAALVVVAILAIGKATIGAAIESENALAGIQAQLGLSEEAAKKYKKVMNEIMYGNLADEKVAGQAALATHQIFKLQGDEAEKVSMKLAHMHTQWNADITETSWLAQDMMKRYRLSHEQALDAIGFALQKNYGKGFDTIGQMQKLMEEMPQKGRASVELMLGKIMTAADRNVKEVNEIMKINPTIQFDPARDAKQLEKGMDAVMNTTEAKWKGFWDKLWNDLIDFDRILTPRIAMRNINKAFVPGYASGTSFHPGGLAMVGERGPELLQLPRGSRVYTNSETRNMLSGGDVFNISVSASNIKELNDLVRIAQNARISRRAGYVG